MAFGLFELFQEVDRRIAKAKVDMGFTGSTLDGGTIGGALPPSVLPDLAGDVIGPPAANVVEAIQGVAVDPAPPTAGDVLTALDADSAEWAAPGASTDVLAKVSSNDTTAGYLNGKLVAGANVTLIENNDGSNETLTIDASGSGIAATIVDVKGDLIAATAADTVARLAAGANDTILMADSGQSTGLKWVASQTPSTQAFSDAATEGTADTYARGDHKHGMPASPGGGSASTIYTSAYASAPGSPANGDWWYPSDSVGLYAARISGAWQWFLAGVPVSLPVAVASWTWVNQSTSTATDVGGGIYLLTPVGSVAQNYRCLVKTAPATPWTVTAAFLPRLWSAAQYDSVNLICRESGTGKIQGPIWNPGSTGVPGLYHQQMTSATVHSANPSAQMPWYAIQPLWFQLSDNGTNIISRVSDDGRNWDQVYTQSRTAFMAGGPNQVGWAVNGFASAGAGAATLVAWMES